MKLHNVRMLRSCSLVGLVCLGVSGCTAPGSAKLTPPIHFVRATSAAPVSAIAPLAAAASVQPFPLYRQATHACEQKDFKGAERLLQRLAATPGLSVRQKRFVLEQRNLCLFDGDNNLTSFTDVSGTTSRSFDADDRLLSESKGGSTVVSHTYDATGKLGLLATTTDANSRVITYSYTTRNQLYQVSETAGTTTYSYNANGSETGITNPNGTTVIKGFDNASQLTSVINKNSTDTVLSAFSYVLDTDGRRESCTEADSSVVSYGYDWGSRLTSESRTISNPYSRSYVVDPVGNRTSQTVGTATTSFTLDSDDQLNSTASSTGGFTNSYGYDANGEQTSRTLSGTAYTQAFDYDGELIGRTRRSGLSYRARNALHPRILHGRSGIEEDAGIEPG